MKIPLLRPTLPPLEALEDKIREVLETGMLTEGKYVREFEERCKEYLGVEGVAAVSSGTAALTLLLLCMDIKGEVIVPSFTYSSGGHVPLWCGATPVFADINPETLNVDPSSIESKITPRTTAIMPVHVFGNPCDVEAIERIAQRHNVRVLYDAAHAFGSLYKGKSVVSYGDASAVSLTPTKVLTTGEGGLVVSNNTEFMDKVQIGKNNGDSFEREKEFLGITARMPEIPAILGIEGLKRLPETLERRQKMVKLYQQELQDVPGIAFQKVSPDASSVYYNLVILVDEEKFGRSRDELLQLFAEKEIETKVYFYPVHKKTMYRERATSPLPNTEYVAQHIMNLPLYSHMPEEQVRYVCDVVKKAHRSS